MYVFGHTKASIKVNLTIFMGCIALYIVMPFGVKLTDVPTLVQLGERRETSKKGKKFQ